jgi:hypothetical protein
MPMPKIKTKGNRRRRSKLEAPTRCEATEGVRSLLAHVRCWERDRRSWRCVAQGEGLHEGASNAKREASGHVLRSAMVAFMATHRGVRGGRLYADRCGRDPTPHTRCGYVGSAHAAFSIFIFLYFFLCFLFCFFFAFSKFEHFKF